jgi:uncharacterized membrane protein (UPF0127 family)
MRKEKVSLDRRINCDSDTGFQILLMKSQITNSKFQIGSKFQIRMSAPHLGCESKRPSPLPLGERVGVRGFLNFGHWNLFGIWGLEFGASLVFLLLLTSTALSENLLKIPLYIKSKEIWVEVAKTPEERNRGLMGRNHLGKDEGMLFVFEKEDYHSFWMKDTRIPLSIAFIDKEGRIVSIQDMRPLTLESHTPPQLILYALEMKKDWFFSNGIKAGDVVKFSK